MFTLKQFNKEFPTFRVWDKKYKTMCKVHSIDLKDKTINGVYVQKRCILMQSTGIIDINGKEVFELDIISYMFDHGLGEQKEYAVVNDGNSISEFISLVGEEIKIEGNWFEDKNLKNLI